ncbi:MAG: 4-alpha-glucanotransferase [Thermoguttaceae bacterium]
MLSCSAFCPDSLSMPLHRSSGVLLHPTSLPGRFGVGDVGPGAFRFVDWLAEGGQTFWQFLPLGPPGDGNSPYQSLSAFAGNPLLISPEALAEAGLLVDRDLLWAEDECAGGVEQVDFPRVEEVKDRLLAVAGERFSALPADHALVREFDDFCRRQASWLENFTAFMALREANGQQAWTCWHRHVNGSKEPLPGVLEHLQPRIRFHAFVQWTFSRQWQALRRYANGRGVRLIGDLPIYVSHDGADVWAERELFQLDAEGRPTAVAGVPPDYFSETGQLWNNPLYDWQANRQQGYAWWIRRVRFLLERVDWIRLDHFRGEFATIVED